MSASVVSAGTAAITAETGTSEGRRSNPVHSAAFSYGFRNFSQKMKTYSPGTTCASEDFVCGGMRWSLKLFPAGVTIMMYPPHIRTAEDDRIVATAQENVGLFLYFHNPSTDNERLYRVKFRLYVVDSQEGQPSEKIYRDFVTTNFIRSGTNVGGAWNLVSRKQLTSHPFTLLPDDVLTVGCELSWSYENGTNRDVDFESPSSFSFPPASNEVALFGDSNYNDFKIQVGDKTLYASKLLLAQKSPVFKAMFANNGFRENRLNCVTIEGVDPAVFEGVLKYCHTGIIPNMEPSVAKEWLLVSDRYDIASLKILLEKGLTIMLSPENAVEIFLIVAVNTWAPRLREEALKFIKNNWQEVMQTNCFERLEVSSALWIEMTRSFACKRCRSSF